MLSAALLVTSFAFAQNLELSHDYVIAPSDRLGMGGAGIAFAHGVAGTVLVPGVMTRRKPGKDDVVLLDGAARLSTLGWSGSDLPNLGDASFRGTMAMVGGGVLVRRVGFSAMLTATRSRPVGQESQMDDGELHTVVALASPNGHVHLGLGAALALGRVTRADAEERWFTVAPLIGLQVDLPPPGLSMAVSMQSYGIDRNMGTGSSVEGAVMPAQGAVGLAWASVAGPTLLRRHPTRLAIDAVFKTPVRDGISPEAWMLGEERTRGARPTVEPRAGAEVEVWPDRVRLRAGTYLEPAHNEGASRRLHGTGGLEVRLFDLPLFGSRWPIAFRSAVDLAPRYKQLQLIGASFWQRVPPPAG